MSAPVQAGDILAGKYRVERILGQGGMGVVVAAEHIELGERVALKFMLAAAAANPAAVERFTREARAAAKLKTQHVARVTDVGRLEDGSPYIVMEYLEGHDLGTELDSRGIMGPEIVDYILQACVAVAEAHRHRIVHRDLKPENLFITRAADGSPLVKVLDFGISKLLAEGDNSTTKTSSAMGSPAYMAPEQMRSAKHVDERADLWSLGAILYHALTGQLPFSAETIPEMFALVLTEPHTPILQVAPQLPPGLAQAVEGCLIKDPNARIQSVAQLSSLLMPFASNLGQTAGRSVSRISGVYSQAAMPDLSALESNAHGIPRLAITTHRAASGQVATPTGPTTQTQNPAPSSSRGMLAVAAIAVLVIGGGVFTYTRSQGAAVDGDIAAGEADLGSPVAPTPAAASAPGPETAIVPETVPRFNAEPAAAPVGSEGERAAAALPQIGSTRAQKRQPTKTATPPAQTTADSERKTDPATDAESSQPSKKAESSNDPAVADEQKSTDEDAETAAAEKKHPCDAHGFPRDSEKCVEYMRKQRRPRKRKKREKNLFNTMQ